MLPLISSLGKQGWPVSRERATFCLLAKTVFANLRQIPVQVHPMSRSVKRVLVCLTWSLICSVFLSGLARAALDAPVSPHAQPGVGALMRVLDGISGKYILAGQQELGWDARRVDEDIAFIREKTGKSPVVRGLDFGDYTLDEKAPQRLRATERAIEWAKQGGVVTFSCHMCVTIGSPNGSAQFYSFNMNSAGTRFDIRQAVIEGTPENREVTAQMDVVAHELKKLRDAGVTVIWRPFHECSGNWFWWGVHGPEPYKKLWRLMFERYTRHHGLTNLIWCYNPTDAAEKMAAWYPGDDVVDMIGIDVYPKTGVFWGLIKGRHPTYSGDYKRMRAFTAGRKVVAMTENGAIPDPDKLFAEDGGWSYFLTWNEFASNPAQNSLEFLKSVYAHPRVITLDEFPSIYAAHSAK